ncbi:MAG: nicotinate (nicotinamide) nucleotide adenylyltransferase [Verrucomicrobia bacterium]|nr:nicotinate (nicotinamide) nucleotide adenylyltransferase [Verrucomicrobiota bacterium]
MENIGVYGGTFDPVHHAHLILAREAADNFQLARVILVPAAISPFKPAPLTPADARLEMLRAATLGDALFAIDDCELQRPPPSYTVETVELLRAKYSGAGLFLLLGDDNLAGLPRWHRYEDLRKMVTIIILSRARRCMTHEYEVVNRRIDISSTEIRERVRASKSIRYFVPPAVEDIITQRRLYQEVPR